MTLLIRNIQAFHRILNQSQNAVRQLQLRKIIRQIRIIFLFKNDIFSQSQIFTANILFGTIEIQQNKFGFIGRICKTEYRIIGIKGEKSRPIKAKSLYSEIFSYKLRKLIITPNYLLCSLMARSISRFAERSAISARLSYSFLPLQSPT